jgi:hypothetical protein
MLFFRSEEAVNAWCEAKQVPRRPTVSLQQLWELSVAWYGNRLMPDARRPGPDEIRRIFTGLGLDDPFWDPQSDYFG